MKTNKEIDLTEIESLPDEVKENILKKPKRTNMEQKILSIFNIKNPINIDELIIGLYKKYQIVIKRNNMYAQLGYLKLKGLITKISDSHYKLIDSN